MGIEGSPLLFYGVVPYQKEQWPDISPNHNRHQDKRAYATKKQLIATLWEMGVVVKSIDACDRPCLAIRESLFDSTAATNSGVVSVAEQLVEMEVPEDEGHMEITLEPPDSHNPVKEWDQRLKQAMGQCSIDPVTATNPGWYMGIEWII